MGTSAQYCCWTPLGLSLLYLMHDGDVDLAAYLSWSSLTMSPLDTPRGHGAASLQHGTRPASSVYYTRGSQRREVEAPERARLPRRVARYCHHTDSPPHYRYPYTATPQVDASEQGPQESDRAFCVHSSAPTTCRRRASGEWQGAGTISGLVDAGAESDDGPG